MNKCILISIFILVCGCKRDGSPIHESNNEPGIPSPYFVDVKKWENEILSLDSMRINDALKYLNHTDSLLEFLDKPLVTCSYSSTRESYLSYLLKDRPYTLDVISYRGLILEHAADLYVVKFVDFENSNARVEFPNLSLSNGLSVRKICEKFPESCKLTLVSGNAWSGHITLRTSSKPLDPRRIFLIFRGERLIKMKIETFSLN